MATIYYREDQIDVVTYWDGERSDEKPIAFLFGGNAYGWYDLEDVEQRLTLYHKAFCEWVAENEFTERFNVTITGAVLKEYAQTRVDDVWCTDMERATTKYNRVVKVYAAAEDAMLFRLRFADIIAECDPDV